MVKIADTKKNTAREGVEKIRHATTSRARYMRLDVTLIATFYSVEPLMPAALAFQPKKIILLVNKLEGDAEQNIEKVKRHSESWWK
jgi:hypothetical protein